MTRNIFQYIRIQGWPQTRNTISRERKIGFGELLGTDSRGAVAFLPGKKLQVPNGWPLTQCGYTGQQEDPLPLSELGPSVGHPVA
jgi:hypothetical protein